MLQGALNTNPFMESTLTVCVQFYEYDLPHINTTAGKDLLCCQTCWTLGEPIIKKNLFQILVQKFPLMHL